MPIFDGIAIVDWSARGAPSPRRPSKDAIWAALAAEDATRLIYARTRHAAMRSLSDLMRAHLDAGRRLLIGFDFPFGYPQGAAARIAGRAEAFALWSRLADLVADGPENRPPPGRMDRFQAAEALNALWPGVGPFWGRPAGRDLPGLPDKGRARDRPGTWRELRRCEAALGMRGLPRAQPVWKLFTTGSVGSQSLLGLPRLQALRRDFGSDLQVWPFDTGFRPPDAPLALVEVWPSLIGKAVAARRRPDEILDRAQVRVLAEALRRLDQAERLAPLFAAPQGQGPGQGQGTADLARIAQEEGWILGLDQQQELEAAALRPAG